MERVKRKMDVAEQQRKRLQENAEDVERLNDWIDGKPTSTLEKFTQHLTTSQKTFLLLAGTAAGVAIAIIVWWAEPVRTVNNSSMISLESAESIQTSEIKNPSDNIAHLNERVEMLTDTITDLEVKLMRVLVLADGITDLEHKLVTANARAVFNTMEPTASGVAKTTPETEGVFTPTHTVKAKLNLRPSASLNTTPVAVLKVGSRVEYISEIDGWYYVNAQSHGKGWCSSDYLSPLLPTHQRASVN